MLINDNQYLSVIESIKSEISKAQYNAVLQVNKEMTLLYYHIGKIINAHKAWGNKFIDNLAKDIKITYPNSTGYSVKICGYVSRRKICARGSCTNYMVSQYSFNG